MLCDLSRGLVLLIGLLVARSLSAADLSELQTAAAQKQLVSAAKQLSAAMRQEQSLSAKLTKAPAGLWNYTGQAAAFTDTDPNCEHLSAGVLETLATSAATSTVPASLIRAVIAEESAGRPCAVSAKGALGLMQLMPATAQDMGISDPLDAAQNVRGGARYLEDLLARYRGDLNLALAAYNAGPVRVDAHGDIPPFAETQRYVRRVLERLKPDLFQ